MVLTCIFLCFLPPIGGEIFRNSLSRPQKGNWVIKLNRIIQFNASFPDGAWDNLPLGFLAGGVVWEPSVNIINARQPKKIAVWFPVEQMSLSGELHTSSPGNCQLDVQQRPSGVVTSVQHHKKSTPIGIGVLDTVCNSSCSVTRMVCKWNDCFTLL